MKRDYDLLRSIMLGIEERQHAAMEIRGNEVIDAPAGTPGELDEWARTLSAHLKMLDDEGFIASKSYNYLGSGQVIAPPENFVIFGITTAGYDFLDSIRSPAIWTKTKDALVKVGGSASLDVVKSLAVAIAKAALGIPG